MRRRVERSAGRRVGRRGFSDQWGESEISARRDLTAASLGRMICQREAKEATDRAAGRRWSRRWEMVRRVWGGGDGGEAVESISAEGFSFSEIYECGKRGIGGWQWREGVWE